MAIKGKMTHEVDDVLLSRGGVGQLGVLGNV
jgi:hypothetical protein